MTVYDIILLNVEILIYWEIVNVNTLMISRFTLYRSYDIIKLSSKEEIYGKT